MGNLDHVRDADIAKAAHFFADTNRSAVLLDRWIREQCTHALIRAVEADAGGAGCAMNVDFAVGAAGNGDVTGRIVQLEANRPADAERAVEGAAGRRPDRAARAGQSCK